jgi:hypothetical protein
MRRAIDKQKKTAAVAAIAVMLCVAACGGSSKTPAQTASSQKASSTQSQSSSSSQTKSASAETQRSSQSAEEANAKRVLTARIAGAKNMVRCMRAHGLHVPPQNLAKGFSARGMDSSSPQFKQAYPGCLRASIKVYDIVLQD